MLWVGGLTDWRICVVGSEWFSECRLVNMNSCEKQKKTLAPSRSPLYIAATGSLAQLVERFVYTEDVGSSSLSRPTINFLEYSYYIDPLKSKLTMYLCAICLRRSYTLIKVLCHYR